MSRLRGRLGRLEGAARARDLVVGPALLVVYPDGWPAADLAAWDAAWAAGDRAARLALVAKHAGQAPGSGTTVLELRERVDGRR